MVQVEAFVAELEWLLQTSYMCTVEQLGAFGRRLLTILRTQRFVNLAQTLKNNVAVAIKSGLMMR